MSIYLSLGPDETNPSGGIIQAQVRAYRPVVSALYPFVLGPVLNVVLRIFLILLGFGRVRSRLLRTRRADRWLAEKKRVVHHRSVNQFHNLRGIEQEFLHVLLIELETPSAVGTALGIWLLIFSPIDLFKCSESHTQNKMIYCNLI